MAAEDGWSRVAEPGEAARRRNSTPLCGDAHVALQAGDVEESQARDASAPAHEADDAEQHDRAADHSAEASDQPQHPHVRVARPR